MKVYKITQNVIKYSFGKPIATQAVVVEGHEFLKEKLDYFKVDKISGLKFTYKMLSDAIVFGLGENQRGINKRGGIYEAFCSDDPRHTPDKKSLYGAHNFLVIEGKEKFGLFVDYPGKVIFDVGFTHKDYLEISLEEQDADIYIIKGEKPLDIVREFLNIIGESYVPPKWAFGYQQSRWSLSLIHI